MFRVRSECSQPRVSVKGRRGLTFALALILSGCGPADPLPQETTPKWEFEREFDGGPVRLILRLDKLKASLADQLILEEELQWDAGFVTEFPEFLPEDFSGFSVVDLTSDLDPNRAPEVKNQDAGEASASAPPPATPPGRRRKRLTLEPERSGTLTIAPLYVYFHAAGQAREDSFKSDEVRVEITPIENVADLELEPAHDIFSAPPVSSEPNWMLWTSVVGGVLMLGGAAYWLWQRPRRLPPPIPPHELAYEALRRLTEAGLIEKGEIERFFVHLSGILRDYIERRFNVRAPERTTEEFLVEAVEHPNIGRHHERLRQFLRLSDQVKFAKFQPQESDIQGAFDVVRTFLAETRPVHA